MADLSIDRDIRFVSLSSGYESYSAVLDLQQKSVAARIARKIADTVYLLEHAPTITIGRGANGDQNLLSSRDSLSSKGIVVIEADRGGDITYHGPGQLVGYPIMDLNSYGRDLHHYLRLLERTLIETLAMFQIDAYTVAGRTGVWVGERKIAAIGIKVSRWVTMHGFALNINSDLTPMRRDIIPCGINDKDVTSLAELGTTTTRSEVEKRLATAFCLEFGAQSEIEYSSLATELERLPEI